MMSARKSLPPTRERAEKPATVSFNQRSLTEWYAEWKARKAAATPPAAAPAGSLLHR